MRFVAVAGLHALELLHDEIERLVPRHAAIARHAAGLTIAAAPARLPVGAHHRVEDAVRRVGAVVPVERHRRREIVGIVEAAHPDDASILYVDVDQALVVRGGQHPLGACRRLERGWRDGGRGGRRGCGGRQQRRHAHQGGASSRGGTDPQTAEEPSTVQRGANAGGTVLRSRCIHGPHPFRLRRARPVVSDAEATSRHLHRTAAGRMPISVRQPISAGRLDRPREAGYSLALEFGGSRRDKEPAQRKHFFDSPEGLNVAGRGHTRQRPTA